MYVAVFVFTDLMLQNLYQYAFAFSNIQGRFLIYTMSPRAAVPCSEVILANGRFGHVFAVEEDESGIDPAVLFVATSESSTINLESNDAERNMQTVENNVASVGSDDTEPLYPSYIGILSMHVCIYESFG